MVSLALIAILLGEQTANHWGVRIGPWARYVRWGLLAATYSMNTWQSWADKDPAAILLHSVPPLLVVLAAEAVTDLRESLNRAVGVASRPEPTIEPAGTLFIDDTPTIPIPLPILPVMRQLETPNPSDEDDDDDEDERDEEEDEKPPALLPGKALERAKAFYFACLDAGEDPSPDDVATDPLVKCSRGYVKRAKHLVPWREEWEASRVKA
jgi:hypothetical protein